MPEDSDYLKLGLLVIFLALSAFFSGSETAFIATQRVRLLHLVRSGVPGAEQVSQMVHRPERLFSTVLLGNNLVNTAIAALGTAIVISILDNRSSSIVVSTAGVTLLLLIFGETLPKTIAANHPERIAFLTVRPLQFIEWLFFPLTRALQGLSYAIIRLTGGTSPPSLVTEQEIRTLISVGKEAGAVEPSEAEMLEKVFRFGDQQVREIITPRPEIVWVERGTTLREFLDLYSEHAHTRFPVFLNSIDNVIGLLSVKDVVRVLAGKELQLNDSVTHLLRPVHFIPETKNVGVLFDELREQGQSMAMVVDEFGGIAGLVTLKQLLEVIVGRVGEEGQPIEEQYAAVDENTYLLDASLGIPEINERLTLDLPLGEYQTLAGFILECLGHIPREGDHLDYTDLRLTVREMQGVKIQRVEVQRMARVADRDEG